MFGVQYGDIGSSPESGIGVMELPPSASGESEEVPIGVPDVAWDGNRLEMRVPLALLRSVAVGGMNFGDMIPILVDIEQSKNNWQRDWGEVLYYKLVDPRAPVGVESDGHREVPPQSPSLSGNYPNPFNSGTLIRFELHRAGPANLIIYDLRGRRVRTLADGFYGPGSHRLIWDGRDDGGNEVASGIYLYQLRTEGFTGARRMVLLR